MRPSAPVTAVVNAGRPGSKVDVRVGRVTRPDGMPTTGVTVPSAPRTEEVNGMAPNGNDDVMAATTG